MVACIAYSVCAFVWESARGVCKRSTRCRGALFRVNIYRENTMHIKVLRGFVHLEGFCGSNSAAATQSAERCSYVTRPHHFQRRTRPLGSRFSERTEANSLDVPLWRCCSILNWISAAALWNFSWKRRDAARTFSQHPIMPRKWMGKSTRRFKCSVAQNFPPHQTGATICFNVGAFSLSLLFYIFGAAYTLHFNFFH